MTDFSVFPVASGLHGSMVIAQLVDSVRAPLEEAGAKFVHTVEAADPFLPLAVLVVTGGTERLVLQALSARQPAAPGEPVLLISHPDHNSLPASLEALARLHLDGSLGRIVMVRPTDNLETPSAGEPQADRAPTDLVSAVHDLTVWHRLHAARIGLLGEPSDWLVASTPDREGVHRHWGVTVLDVDLPGALHRYESVADAPIAVPVRLRARRTATEPGATEVTAAARFEPVLREVVSEHRLDAVAVRCFDLVTGPGTSGCLALSSLNDSGVIAGCEGDTASTLALLWMRELTGRLGWMANPAVADPRSGVIELAHCTVPLSLVSGYELHTHFESGLGVGISGDLPPGPVTLVRLGGSELEQLWCYDAEALTTRPRPNRCRTQLDVRVAPEAVAELLEHPLGNHIVVVAGHHAHHAHQWSRTMLPLRSR